MQVQTCRHSYRGIGTDTTVTALIGSILKADTPLQCQVIAFGIVLKLEASWKVVCSTFMFTRVLLAMLSITLEINCGPESSIHMHVSRIDFTKFKYQKQKLQGCTLVRTLCSRKRTLNYTVGKTSPCRVQSSVLLPPQ